MPRVRVMLIGMLWLSCGGRALLHDGSQEPRDPAWERRQREWEEYDQRRAAEPSLPPRRVHGGVI